MVRRTIQAIPNRNRTQQRIVRTKSRVTSTQTPATAKTIPAAPELIIRVVQASTLDTPILSVLIPTVPGREIKLASVLHRIESQWRSDVEVIVGYDERTMTIGEKRNRMIAAASGEYVTFVDDDDMVTTDYLDTIVQGLLTRPDVLTYRVLVKGYGPTKICIYGLALANENVPHGYHRRPNHLMVWKRSIAASVPFPHVKIGEDTQWADAIQRLATREVALDNVLYHYQFDPTDNSATPR